jgi:basic amino acid/polyamine antiporter, APA family
VVLVKTLPPLSVGLGVLMFAAGIILRLVRLRSNP